MCGIFGAIRLRGRFGATDYERFRELTDLVHYRGPDDSGYECFDTASGAPTTPDDFNVFLGHRRLSIVDRSRRGHQPMSDGQGAWLVYNGEVYNYPELRAELPDAAAMRSDTDTEVVHRWLGHSGGGGCASFNGMWALARLDLRRRRLLLARDRFGIKPLYLLRRGDECYFASELKQLLPLLSDRTPDRNVLLQFLARGVIHDGGGTLFRDIEAFPTRHYAELDLESGEWSQSPYWAHTTSLPIPEGDERRMFRELFDDAVRLRLRADVPVGVLLSGGLDSSSIAASAAAALPQGLDAYAMVTDDPAASEERFVDALAGTPGLRIHKLRAEAATVAARLDRALWQVEAPHSSLTFLNHYALMEQIRRETDITVVLSGQGGDELLMGYRKYFFFALLGMLRRGRLLGAATLAGQSIRQRTVLTQFSLADARRYLPGAGGAPYLLADAPPLHLGARGTVTERQIADIDRFSVPILTHYEDRSSMAQGIEVRLPFLDHRLVEFMTSVDEQWKLRGGWTKYVLREAMTELPPSIRWRRDKQAFHAPYRQWVAQDLAEEIRAAFSGSHLQRLGLVDERAFLERFERFRGGRRDISPHEIARVYLAERWARIFLGDAGPIPEPAR